MADDNDELHSCFTEFMLATCCTSTSNVAVSDVLSRICIRQLRGTYTEFEVFTSGSSAEFYITPPLPHIGDTDMMLCYNSRIAIPERHKPPSELPSHYHSIVDVYEIIDSHLPGYVYLKPMHVLKKNEDGFQVINSRETGESEVEFLLKDTSDQIRRFQLISRSIADSQIIFFPEGRDKPSLRAAQNLLYTQAHGPALLNKVHFLDIQTVNEDVGSCNLVRETDMVLCVRCLTWPPQAAEWPTRSRSYGWPDPPTIDMIVNNGCDVVTAVHPSCQQDEWMSKHQWRLSFSRAEITLLNSWSPVQQIIYHMLRFVLKYEVLSKTNDSDKSLLSNYHIKTLMLWECEQKPQSWWSTESSFVKLCSSLLHKLCDRVAEEYCQQYFITNCNLLDHFVDDDASLLICNNLQKNSRHVISFELVCY